MIGISSQEKMSSNFTSTAIALLSFTFDFFFHKIESFPCESYERILKPDVHHKGNGRGVYIVLGVKTQHK